MNINNILNDEYFTFLGDNKNVAFYSLSIGLEEYFETYHRVCIMLSQFHRGDKAYINEKTKGMPRYVKSYLNIAIHIQHFFELETKRLLENENILFSVDDKGDPLILNKLLKNQELSEDDTKSLKSVEFSEAITRLKKLVNNGVITDEVAVLFATNDKLLKALNKLRNTIIHRGKRIMLYCELDELFSQNILPLVKEVLNCQHYHWCLSEYKQTGIYDSICKIIDEGKKNSLNYPAIAYEKELARCRLIVNKNNIEKGTEDKGYIAKIIARRLQPFVEEVYMKDKKCPCCENYTMFQGREFIGYDIDELGDEYSSVGGFQIIHVPEYAEYNECGLCGFLYTSFLDI